MTALTSMKRRQWAGELFVDLVLPIKATHTIYAGAALEWNAGYAENLSGAGTFAGFALEDSVAVAGEADGARSINVRVKGMVELPITTDTPAQTDIGVNTIEATDNDTFRIETGTAITGTLIGKPVRLVNATTFLVDFQSPLLV